MSVAPARSLAVRLQGRLTAAPMNRLSPVRWLVLAVAGVLVLLAVSGVLAATAFTQPTTIKYLVTVAGAALVALVAMAQAPLAVLVAVAIVAAPFDFVTTVDGIQVTPVLAVDVLAVLVWLSLPRTSGASALRPMAAVFAALLAPAIVGSSAPAQWLVWLAITLVTGGLTFVVARQPGGPALVAAALTVSAVIQAAIALWEHRSGHQLNLYQAPGSASYGSQYFFTYGRYDRPSGALPDPIGLGQLLALCLPIMVALAAAARRPIAVIAVLAAVVVTAVALLLSLSRMAIIGGGVGCAVALVALPRRAMVTRGLEVVVIVAVAALLGLAFGGRTLTQRLDSILHPTAAHVTTAAADRERTRIWRAAAQIGEANPVAGVGFGNVTRELPRHGVAVTSAANAQNTYLQWFAEGGVPGLFALLAVIAAAGLDLTHGLRHHRVWAAGATGALVATLLCWLTDVEVRYVQLSAVVAALLGLIAALGARDRTGSESGAREGDHPAP